MDTNSFCMVLILEPHVRISSDPTCSRTGKPISELVRHCSICFRGRKNECNLISRVMESVSQYLERVYTIWASLDLKHFVDRIVSVVSKRKHDLDKLCKMNEVQANTKHSVHIVTVVRNLKKKKEIALHKDN